MQWIAERALSAPPATTYADFRANDRFDVLARLGGITAPTLVIGAEDDRTAPPKSSEFLAARIPGARLAILPACSHHPGSSSRRRSTGRSRNSSPRPEAAARRGAARRDHDPQRR